MQRSIPAVWLGVGTSMCICSAQSSNLHNLKTALNPDTACQSWDCTTPVHNLKIVQFLLHVQLNPGCFRTLTVGSKTLFATFRLQLWLLSSGIMREWPISTRTVVWQLVQYGRPFYSPIRYSYISFQLYVLLFRYVTNISIYSLTHAILSLCLMMIARVVIETLQIKFCYQPSKSKMYCLNEPRSSFEFPSCIKVRNILKELLQLHRHHQR